MPIYINWCDFFHSYLTFKYEYELMFNNFPSLCQRIEHIPKPQLMYPKTTTVNSWAFGMKGL